MIEAQPYKGGKKGADSGIDGLICFKPDGKTTEKAIVEVKGGDNVSPQWVRALGQVVERAHAVGRSGLGVPEIQAGRYEQAEHAGYLARALPVIPEAA